jgi:hypothetical protein
MDLTQEEFNEKMLMKPEAFKRKMNTMNGRVFEKVEDLTLIDEEELKDDNDHNYKNEERKELKERNFLQQTTDIDHMAWEPRVKNQGGCGSCWAFAAIGAVENHYHKLTGNLTYFSEQYLVDCDNYDHGCYGGYPTNIFEWISENGLVAENVSPYLKQKEICDDKLKNFEYKIVEGASEYNPNNKNYEELLAKGPLVVGINSSFEGFMDYRPVNFDPISPKTCGGPNHIVTVVGLKTENGKKYIIARNSWGTHFGYKGYFKMPFDNSCGMSTYAWLPLVNKGHVPDGKPQPKSEPIISRCVTLSGIGGFSHKIMETCDSVPELSTPSRYFIGIKFPRGNDGVNLYVFLFKEPNCSGWIYVRINYSVEFLERFGFTPMSLAFQKNVSKVNCVDFFLKTCHAGEPELTVCGDVADSQLYNYTRLKEIKSMIVDTNIIQMTFYTRANFSGDFLNLPASSTFNIQPYILRWISKNTIRSIKLATRTNKN